MKDFKSTYIAKPDIDDQGTATYQAFSIAGELASVAQKK
jgi:hypothetical protein